MICSNCGVAGDLIKARRTLPEKFVTGENGYRGRDLINNAQFLHQQCKGDTHCDCQHKIDVEGKMVQGG